jgi:hypothetical protein
MNSIFQLTDLELLEKFWEDIPFDVLKQNASQYKDELISILHQANTRFQSRTLLKKLFSQESYVHKWKIWLAFWDVKWAKYCFDKAIIEWESIPEKYLFELNNLQNKSI